MKLLISMFILSAFLAAAGETNSIATLNSKGNVMSASNSVPIGTNRSKAAEPDGKTNTVSEEAYFKKVTDSESGLCATIGVDKNTITLKDKSGHVIWTLNLTNAVPGMPSGGINDLTFYGQLEGKPHSIFGSDLFGKESEGYYSPFWIDVDTGKVTGGGRVHMPIP